jgi:hypothetical protein
VAALLAALSFAYRPFVRDRLGDPGGRGAAPPPPAA